MYLEHLMLHLLLAKIKRAKNNYKPDTVGGAESEENRKFVEFMNSLQEAQRERGSGPAHIMDNEHSVYSDRRIYGEG